MEALTGLVYLSRANMEFDEARLKELENHAAQRNAGLGVTGYLFFFDGKFVQYIEGLPSVVADLMTRIRRDDRHAVIYELNDSIDRRRFPAWDMRLIRRKSFMSFEHLLTDHLSFANSLPDQNTALDHEFAKSVTWRMIESMSALHTALEAS